MDQYPEYIKNIYKSVRRQKPTSRHFTKRKYRSHIYINARSLMLRVTPIFTEIEFHIYWNSINPVVRQFQVYRGIGSHIVLE